MDSYGSNDDQLMQQDQLTIKNAYESCSYCIFVPDPITVS